MLFRSLPDYKSLKENQIIISDKEKLFCEFCSYSLFNLYDIFCESIRFKKEIKQVKMQDGKRIGLLYEFVSTNFLAYYKYSKPHLTKNKDIVSQSENNESISKNNYVCEKSEDTNIKKNINFVIN